jgi:hypothetical protein
MRTFRLLGLLVLALTVAGCKAPPGRIKFNDRMARDTKALSVSGREFRKAVEGGAANAKSKVGAIDTQLKAMKEYHADAVLPVSSNSAQAYQDAFKDFLEAEGKVVGKMRDIVQCLETGQGGRVSGIYGEITALEAPAMQKLRNAQKAFCDEHNFRTVEKYPD